MDRYLDTADDVKRSASRALEADIKINRDKIDLLKSKVSRYLSPASFLIRQRSCADCRYVPS